MKYKTKNHIMHGVLILFLAAAILLGYFFLRQQTVPIAGEIISITIEVVHGNGESKTVLLTTDEEYLGGALLEGDLAQGEQQQYGLYIDSVDGETAQKEDAQWWCITKEGESVLTGADATPIADGERYELTLITGW